MVSLSAPELSSEATLTTSPDLAATRSSSSYKMLYAVMTYITQYGSTVYIGIAMVYPH